MPWDDRIKPGLDVVIEKALAEAKQTMRAGDDTTPPYYRFVVKGLELAPFDIIEAFNFNFNLGCVTKYLLRAGRKGPALDDLRKARNCLDREIRRLEGLQP